MIRDKLNTDTGYQEIVEQTNKFIIKSLERIENLLIDEANGVQNHPKSNKEIIDSTKWRLFNDYFDLIKTEYSAGESVEKLYPIYSKALEYLVKSWQSEWGYIQMVSMLSLGIILEIEDQEFGKLVSLVERDNVKDFLIDFLIKYRKKTWQQTETFLWNKPYKGVAEIVELSTNNKEKMLERLKKYLKEWYRSIEIKTHESKWNIHKGYWCWEAGAIAKILALDDSSLKDQQYYPYDMIHFKE